MGIEEVTLPIKIQESESSESESESESETDSDSTSSCSDVEPSVHIVEVTKSQCDGLAFVEEFTVDEPLDNEEEDEQNVIVDEPLDNDLEDCEENVIEVNHHESELEEKLEPDQEAMDHDNEI